jgi:two-component system, NtrC family, nitrogen regulation response regulator GlnG
MTTQQDEPTIDPVTAVTAGSRDDAAVVPTLSIQWHPDTSRIGDTSPLLLTAGTTIEVSRRGPLFHSTTGRSAPVNESSISGPDKPSVIITGLSEVAVEIRPGPISYAVLVDGEPLTGPRRFGPAELQNGLVILLRRSVLLFLSLLRHPRPPAMELPGIVGIGDRICDLRERVMLIADRTAPVLIQGESGSGKGAFAQALHRASRRAANPFLDFHLGKAISEQVVTAELFGYERGAFTGAVERREGLFVAADGGTLFLDEIGDAPTGVQTTLLKVLEDGVVLPVGARQSRRVDVRIIAATDAQLQHRITDGSFSPQLYRRLNREELAIPAIRNRREDVGILLVHALLQELVQYGMTHALKPPPDPGVAPWLQADAVAEILQLATTFPFNVATIQNAAGRIVTSAIGRSRAHPEATLAWLRTLPSLHSIATTPSSPAPSPAECSSMTADQMAELWEQCGRSMAAFMKATGLPRSTANRYIKANPLIPKDSEITDADIQAAVATAGGDLQKAAAQVGLSLHRLKQRLSGLKGQ